MKIKLVKIETITKQRRTVYEVDEIDLIQVGPGPIIRSKLQNEDSEVIDLLEEKEEDFEVEDEEETGDEICDTQWFHEDDEI
jgi:hypothetical protein